MRRIAIVLGAILLLAATPKASIPYERGWKQHNNPLPDSVLGSDCQTTLHQKGDKLAFPAQYAGASDCEGVLEITPTHAQFWGIPLNRCWQNNFLLPLSSLRIEKGGGIYVRSPRRDYAFIPAVSCQDRFVVDAQNVSGQADVLYAALTRPEQVLYALDQGMPIDMQPETSPQPVQVAHQEGVPSGEAITELPALTFQAPALQPAAPTLQADTNESMSLAFYQLGELIQWVGQMEDGNAGAAPEVGEFMTTLGDLIAYFEAHPNEARDPQVSAFFADLSRLSISVERLAADPNRRINHNISQALTQFSQMSQSFEQLATLNAEQVEQAVEQAAQREMEKALRGEKTDLKSFGKNVADQFGVGGFLDLFK